MAYLENISTSDQNWNSLKPELMLLGIFEREELSGLSLEVDNESNKAISRCISAGDFDGKEGITRLIYTDSSVKKVLLVGLGKRKKFTLDKLRQAAGRAVKTAQSNKWRTFITEIPGREALNETETIISQAFVEGLILGSYKFLDYKTDSQDGTILDSVVLINNPEMSGVERGRIIAKATCYARDLAYHPSNVMTPSRLASEAKKISAEFNMNCNIFERNQFTEMGLGAFASVAKGTDEPPKFILLEYNGGKKGDKPFAFVGKGITFDSGGISIKQSKGMDEMKFDMCGAAAVLGIFMAVGELQPDINLVGAIAATENMPGGHATKPGDIVKAYNGKTIEILNTDAEGRLVLADTLAYVGKNNKPQYMINFATLTGAVLIVLGHIASGIMGNDRKLIDALQKAGEKTGERVWELPLWDEYCKDVKSKIADVKNIGAFRQAGTIAGGAFLKEFVGSVPWAHIDIAGTAWWDKDRPYIPSGPSGVGVRLSLELLNILG